MLKGLGFKVKYLQTWISLGKEDFIEGIAGIRTILNVDTNSAINVAYVIQKFKDPRDINISYFQDPKLKVVIVRIKLSAQSLTNKKVLYKSIFCWFEFANMQVLTT